METKTNEKLNEFLKKLSELSNEYGFIIRGCGCCGSPWIDDTNSKDCFDNLEFIDNEYTLPGVSDGN